MLPTLAATPFSTPALAAWDTLRCLVIGLGILALFSLTYRWRDAPKVMKIYSIALAGFIGVAIFSSALRIGHVHLLWQLFANLAFVLVTLLAIHERRKWPIIYVGGEEEHLRKDS